MVIKESWWCTADHVDRPTGCRYRGWRAYGTIAFICGTGEQAKRKRIIGHQRRTHRCTGRCIETNDWILGLLTTSPPSSSYDRRPSVRPYLSFSLHVYPSSGPCLSPLTAFLPHSEIPREQAMISNGGALRRRPCSFPFFSVRSSCSSSFCRGSNKDLRPRHPSSLPPTSSQGGAPPAILALRYYRPSSSFFSALPREAWSPLLIRYWSRDPRRLM